MVSRFKIPMVVLAVALSVSMAFSQKIVRTQGGEFHGGIAHMLGFYADYLDLTDAQQAQMKDIIAKEKPTIQPLIQQLAQGHQQMSQLEQAGTFNEASVRALASQQSQTMTELTVQKARIKSELAKFSVTTSIPNLAKVPRFSPTITGSGRPTRVRT